MFSRKLFVPIMLIAVMAAGVTAASAQWKNLGSKDVDNEADHDTMHITFLKGDFRKIKLSVSKAPVHFSRVVVTFGNGETQELDIRDLIPAGGETRAIDLEGRERVIDKIDFWYESASLRGHHAKVTVWGRT